MAKEWCARAGTAAFSVYDDGKYDPAVPPVTGGDGEIDATVSDGAGGFYIGGSFTHVGGVPRGNLAHIRANKTLDPGWHPSAADKVRALAKSGSTVYIGGDFNGADSINGTATRNYAAAVDATTGAVKSWDPNLKDIVEALAASGSKVYIGGYFNGPNAVNGTTTRNRAAAVDTTNATTTYKMNTISVETNASLCLRKRHHMSCHCGATEMRSSASVAISISARDGCADQATSAAGPKGVCRPPSIHRAAG